MRSNRRRIAHTLLMFDPQTWGTVGQWVSGLGTSGSLLLGFYIILRDRRKAEREQAVKIHIRIRDVTLDIASRMDDDQRGGKSYSEFSNSPHPHVYEIDLHNPTETAVTNVRIHALPYSFRQYRKVAKWVSGRPDCPDISKNEWVDRWPRWAVDSTIGTDRDILESKQAHTHHLTLELPRYLITPLVAFTDMHGLRWIRYPLTGKLIRHSYRKENTPKPLKYDSEYYKR